MNEKGITPPPKRPLIGDLLMWSSWERWFQLVTFNFPKVQTFEATLNPTNCAANTTNEQTFTVTGLTTEDIVTVNKPTHTAGIGIVGARVSAANTLAITFGNFTAGGIDPPSESYKIVKVTL